MGDGLDSGNEDLPEKIQKLGFGENIGRCIIEKGWSFKVAEVEKLIGIDLANIVGQFRQGFEIVSVNESFWIKIFHCPSISPEDRHRVHRQGEYGGGKAEDQGDRARVSAVDGVKCKAAYPCR